MPPGGVTRKKEYYISKYGRGGARGGRIPKPVTKPAVVPKWQGGTLGNYGDSYQTKPHHSIGYDG